jgi:hypothetical protein
MATTAHAKDEGGRRKRRGGEGALSRCAAELARARDATSFDFTNKSDLPAPH